MEVLPHTHSSARGTDSLFFLLNQEGENSLKYQQAIHIFPWPCAFFFPAAGEDWCLQAWEVGQSIAGVTACEEHKAVNPEAAAGHSQPLSVLLRGSRHSSVLWFSIPFHQGSDVWKHLLAEQFLSHTIWILLIRLSCSPQSHFCIFQSYQASHRKQHWCYMDSLYYNCVANKNAEVP